MSELCKLFFDPPAIYGPGYFWLLNEKMDAECMRKAVAEQAQKGVKIIYPHPMPVNFRAYACSTMSPDYLTEEYFDCYRAMLEECKARNIHLCLYDEGGFPSGGACGRVLASDPEKFARRFLVSDGPGKVKVEFETIDPQRAPLPDLLNPAAVEKFIELTHEEYYRRFGEYFGTVIKFAFMDEPGFINATPTRLPWCADMPEEFIRRKGYDVVPFLPDMLAMSMAPDVVQARIDFYDVLSWLIVERFTRPLQKWCHDHGILYAGHLDGEDEPARNMLATYGQIMRSLRTLDIPGIDVIWRQLWQGARLHTFPKFASSVANQNGQTRSVAELYGVYGAGLNFQQMRFLASYIFICGLNTIVATDMPMSTCGQRMEGQRPFFSNANPLWKYFNGFHEWITRLCALSSQAAPVVENALFYDSRSLWAHSRIAVYSAEHQEHIARNILERQCDFDYIDDDILETAVYENGKIAIGQAFYRRIIIPTQVWMSEKAQKNLNLLRSQGAEILSSEEAYKIKPLLKFSECNPNILLRTGAYADGSRIHFILNTSFLEQNVSCTFDDKRVVIADPDTGKFYTPKNFVNGKWHSKLAPGELVVLITGAEAVPNSDAPAQPGGMVAELDGEWMVKKVRQYSVGANDYIIENFSNAPEQPAKCGDWAKFLGEDFSGEAEYSLEFEYSGKGIFIDLGDVKYVAAVTLNGIDLGVKLAPPYCFNAAGVLRPGKNHLQIRVTNTLVNAITPAAVWEKWRTELPFVSPYEYISRLFEKDAIPSGLFGPVTLKE